MKYRFIDRCVDSLNSERASLLAKAKRAHRKGGSTREECGGFQKTAKSTPLHKEKPHKKVHTKQAI